MMTARVICGIYSFAHKEGIMRNRSMLRIITFTATLVLSIAQVSYSQKPFEPHMVIDLVTKGEDTVIFNETVVGNTMYFVTYTREHGEELWKTDGTEQGTVMVKDIRPGPESSSPTSLCDVNGILFFAADDGENGNELWKSDGTPEGTVMVRNFSPNELSSLIENIVSFKEMAFFDRAREIGYSGYVQHELYRSDGTPEGTVIVKDINPNYNNLVYPPIPLGSNPGAFLVAGDYLYFLADDGTHGRTLWRTDGTEEGTILIAEPSISPGFDVVGYGVYKNGSMFFGANDLEHGFGLWKTDGTPEGTIFIKTIDGESADFYDQVNFYALGDVFLFFKDRELWSSDGTEVGTILIKEELLRYGGYHLWETMFNDRLIFTARVPEQKNGIWVSDGTEVGTYMIKEFDSYFSGPSHYSVLEDVVIFSSPDNNIWLTDGTGDWTMRLFEPSFSAPIPAEYEFKVLDNRALFEMDDGIHGRELWATSKIPDSYYMVKDISTGTQGADIGDMYAIGDTLYFTANTIIDPDHNYAQLWKTDGTAKGTSLVWPGVISEIKSLNDMLFFLTYENGMNRLYLTKGTPERTTLIWEDSIINLSLLSSAKGMIFFNTRDYNAVDPVSGLRGRLSLFKTDGTHEGTSLLYEVYGTSTVGHSFTEYRGEIFFTGTDIDHGSELWKTDGTAAGTKLFLDIDPSFSSGYPSDSNPSWLIVYNDLLFFNANVTGYGYELWKTDGTVEGTGLVKDFWPGLCPQWWGGYDDCNSGMKPVGVINDKLVLQGLNELNYDYYGLPSLWVSNGTAEGTVLLESSVVDTLVVPSNPNGMVAFKGELYFSGQDYGISDAAIYDRNHSPCSKYFGTELWKTDGTVAGTVMIADIAVCPPDNPLGVRSSFPSDFVIADDLLFFWAGGEEGYYLRMTDGSVGNVTKIDSDVPAVAYANGTIFLENTDGVHGNELWAFRTKIFVDECNTGVTDQLYQGKYITTWIEECADSAKNHGKFVSCVAHLTNDLKKAGLINGNEKGAIQTCAAQADIPE